MKPSNELSSIEERKAYLLKRPSKEISLAIEGKHTNLRIWVDFNGTMGEALVNPPDSIFMRLDKYQAYSVPLDSGMKYLEVDNPIRLKLTAAGFDFISPIDKLDELLELTKDMQYRELLPW